MKLSTPLTDKQADVVRLIGTGLDYKHIAHELQLSIEMVRLHAKAAAKKMPKPYLTTKARIREWCYAAHAVV